MNVLLTADLHSNPGWFRWLEEEAGKYDGLLGCRAPSDSSVRDVIAGRRRGSFVPELGAKGRSAGWEKETATWVLKLVLWSDHGI
jgi:hypothetical protein